MRRNFTVGVDDVAVNVAIYEVELSSIGGSTHWYTTVIGRSDQEVLDYLSALLPQPAEGEYSVRYLAEVRQVGLGNEVVVLDGVIEQLTEG